MLGWGPGDYHICQVRRGRAAGDLRRPDNAARAHRLGINYAGASKTRDELCIIFSQLK